MSKLNDVYIQIKFKNGLAANINTTATKNLAVTAEPHWTTDTKQLYIFDGTVNVRVPTEDSSGNITHGQITISDAKDIIFNTTIGTKIGTSTNQKFAFWNKTPVIQPASANQAAAAAQTQQTLTDSTTGTPSTTLSDVTVVPTQILINNNFASVAARLAELKADIIAIKTLQDQLRTDAVTIGIIKGSA